MTNTELQNPAQKAKSNGGSTKALKLASMKKVENF